MKEKIIFEPQEHKYFWHRRDPPGVIELTSVSKVIASLHDPFDPTGEITSRFAKKHGKSVTEVKEEWARNNKESTDYGTQVHDALEHLILTGEIVNDQYAYFYEEFAKVKFEGKVYPEKRVYSTEHLICGTADILEFFPDKTFRVRDFKTNKKIEFDNPFNKWMNGCCSHLPDINSVHYTIQLSLYAYMVEQFGFTCKGLNIYWFNRETKKIEFIELKYEKELIKNILKEKSWIK